VCPAIGSIVEFLLGQATCLECCTPCVRTDSLCFAQVWATTRREWALLSPEERQYYEDMARAANASGMGAQAILRGTGTNGAAAYDDSIVPAPPPHPLGHARIEHQSGFDAGKQDPTCVGPLSDRVLESLPSLKSLA
jgi:hypothetical protein